MTALSKEDWNTLDNLLSKMGFGGYYDLVKCIKMSIANVNGQAGKATQDEKDLFVLIQVLSYICSRSKQQ